MSIRSPRPSRATKSRLWAPTASRAAPTTAPTSPRPTTGDAGCTGDAGDAGYTLLEVLVVIAILGGVAVLASVDLGTWTERLAVRERAAAVARLVAAARREAIVGQAVVGLTVERTGGAVVLRHGARQARFDGAIVLDDGAAAAGMPPVLYPDGSSNIAAISIAAGRRRLELDGYGHARER